MVYSDRAEAGRVLAGALAAYAGQPGLLVLALPRGGVPVAYEVAQALRAPLDVLVVRKLGVPGHDEYAMGAIASGGEPLFNDEVVRELGIRPAAIDAVVQRERTELQRRERLYRGDRPLPDVCGRTVIVVDDGLATGATMAAAVKALRGLEPARIVVAVPTGAAETCEQLRALADAVVCASTPRPFRAVGQWYDDFSQTSDAEVHELLDRAAQHRVQTA
jgi:putative phosphoribosyl transferase